MMVRKMPILLVEDDPQRVARMSDWLPDTVRFVVCPVGGQALGVLSRCGGNDFGGVMLDHDLSEHAAQTGQLTGLDVADSVMWNVDYTVPIMVHSTNGSRAPLMVDLLSTNFSVTRTPYDKLTRELFLEWLAVCLEEWGDKWDTTMPFVDRNRERRDLRRESHGWLDQT
jgi:hypothetical protein